MAQQIDPTLHEAILRVVEEARRREAPVQAPAADAGPLGLASFALTTFVLSFANAGYLKEAGAFIPLAFFYGGLVQLLAGMWEFRNRNTFAATAFTSYGAFWLALGFFNYFPAELGVKGSSTALGITLIGWAVFTTYMWVAAFKTSAVLLVIFTALLVTLVLLATGVLHASTPWVEAAGWTGMITAAVAWYGSAAGVVNSTFARAVLPTFPLSNAAR